MKKILVPYDDSEYSQKAFEKGLEIAEKFESELIVLTVIQSNVSDSAGISLERLQEIQDEEETAAMDMVKNLEEMANIKKVRLSTKIIHNPSPSDGIVSYVENNGIDLIVIGSHGRTGFKKLVLGSVANGVLTHVKCPVLVTKGTE